MILLTLYAIPVGIFMILLFWCLSLRRIVPPKEVHVVQRTKKTISYGKDLEDGNVYYEFPAWMPVLGVTKTVLPAYVIDLNIPGYDAYDVDKLPFVVDVTAFFRVSDFKLAASRAANVKELEDQLLRIVQGAVRSILANEELESIMSQRSVYGDKFTQEVSDQLKSWGVETVKNIELMDIRDSRDSNVIANIMKKKKSQIEKESRVAVAQNIQKAQEAEILANQEVSLKQQDAQQVVGLRQAAVKQEVGIAEERSMQSIKAEAKITAEKEAEVQQVQQVRAAEIAKQANIVKAEADKGVMVLRAEADKKKAELTAEATLVQMSKEADGIKAQGEAKAVSEKLMQLAPVEAQISLAKEIGENEAYQKYLIALEQIKASIQVGMEQAKNLGRAEVKIFANANSVTEGASKASGIFSSQSGLDVASSLEALASTEVGENLINKFLGGTSNTVQKVTGKILKKNE